MNTELTVIKPAELYKTSTDVAGLCKEFVINASCNIKGKKYPKVEAWQSIAAAHGCIPEIESVQETVIQGINGIIAWAVLRRMSDSSVISRASGFVGQDEPEWPSRNVYARYSMAQTRATSRVCRNAFAYVVVMMNAGLETTPAEEVPSDGFSNPVGSWAKETKAAVANAAPATQPSNGQDTAEGILGHITVSPDGGCWFIDKIGEFGGKGTGKSLWTRDAELARVLLNHEGSPIIAKLQSKKAGSYRVISFEPMLEKEP